MQFSLFLRPHKGIPNFGKSFKSAFKLFSLFAVAAKASRPCMSRGSLRGMPGSYGSKTAVDSWSIFLQFPSAQDVQGAGTAQSAGLAIGGSFKFFASWNNSEL